MMDVGRLPGAWLFLERCTLEARRSIAHSREAVAELGGAAIMPEHILCGLMKEDVAASHLLSALLTAPSELQRQIRQLLAGSRASRSFDVPLSRNAEAVWNHAWSEAEHLGQPKIRSEYLLLGLLAGDTAVAGMLRSHGLDADRVRAAIPLGDPDMVE
jgi:ATP-dependent Clp protease ATP-binding subunit ClpC